MTFRTAPPNHRRRISRIPGKKGQPRSHSPHLYISHSDSFPQSTSPIAHHERLLSGSLHPPPPLAGQHGHARRQLVRQCCRIQEARPEVRNTPPTHPDSRLSASPHLLAPQISLPHDGYVPATDWGQQEDGVSHQWPPMGHRRPSNCRREYKDLANPSTTQIRRSRRGRARIHPDCPQAPVTQGVVRPHLPHPPLRPVQLPAQTAPQGPVDKARGGASPTLLALGHVGPLTIDRIRPTCVTSSPRSRPSLPRRMPLTQ